MSNVVRKLREFDVVSTNSRVWNVSPEAAPSSARSAPAGSHGTVVTTFDEQMEMYSGPRAGYSAHRATVAIVQFTGDDGEFWQTSVNVNALNLIRRTRRPSSTS